MEPEQRRRVSDDLVLQLQAKVDQLTLEISEIRTELKFYRGNKEQALETLTGILHRQEALLHGNGHAGMVTRIDRIEQLLAMGKWVIGASVIFMIQQMGSFIVTLIGTLTKLHG